MGIANFDRQVPFYDDNILGINPYDIIRGIDGKNVLNL